MGAESQDVSVVIAAAPEDVYAYAVDPAHLPEWAAGLATGVTEVGGRWMAESPLGPIEIRFAPRNTDGVLDHEIITADGTVFHNPMRVVPHPDGAEVIFTVNRLAGATDTEFEDDVAAVRADLATLAAVLRIQPPGAI
ncbi:SRPBCC family protein [Microbacterium gorillae]|uniref:SRPBCC family protein n=1 Tax=Microbacterium gorillae TaxID=1231063 RepID=UPI00059147E2|nr:SRPBCC family protein [Microbacterium gorillae]